MFIYTVKAHKLKFILSLTASVFIILSIALLFPNSLNRFSYPDDILPAVKNVEASAFRNIRTNEDRISFLERFGWEVEEEPLEIIEVTVPDRFDSVYESYNQMQLSEGLDLRKVAGKQIKRYTYVVTNALYDGTVLANLLIWQNKVVGGDIRSARIDGFIHGFTRENDFLSGETSE